MSLKLENGLQSIYESSFQPYQFAIMVLNVLLLTIAWRVVIIVHSSLKVILQVLI